MAFFFAPMHSAGLYRPFEAGRAGAIDFDQLREINIVAKGGGDRLQIGPDGRRWLAGYDPLAAIPDRQGIDSRCAVATRQPTTKSSTWCRYPSAVHVQVSPAFSGAALAVFTPLAFA